MKHKLILKSLVITLIAGMIAVPCSAMAAETGTEEGFIDSPKVTSYATEAPSTQAATEFTAAKTDSADVPLAAETEEKSDKAAENTEKQNSEPKEKLAAPAFSMANGVKGLDFAWSKVQGAQFYMVYTRAADEDTWNMYETHETHATWGDPEPGKLYYAKVQAIDGDRVKGEFSAVKSLTYIPRADVTSLSFNGSANTLTWNSVDGANKYQIAKIRKGDKAYTYYTTTSTSFTDKNVTTANAYYYQVRAMYATEKNGTAYGAWSTTKSVVTLAQASVSLANKSNGIRAAWGAVKGAQRYAVYYKAVEDPKWTTASTTNTYYPILNVKPGSLYYVQVRPVAGNISGTYSKLKAMTFIGQPAVTLSNSADGINVSWKEIQGANKYQIAKKKKGASAFEYFTVTGTSYNDRQVAGNTEYCYQVRAMYATENTGTAYGAWSSSKSILKIAQPTVTLSNKSNGMRVEWSKVPGAVKYTVYIKAASAQSWQSATTTNNYYPMLTVRSGVLYYVQVRPIGNGVYGPFSKPKSLMFIGAANLNMSMVNGDLKLSWNSVAGADKYQIAKLKKGNSSYEYIIVNGTSYIDKAVTKKDFYSYQVRALSEPENAAAAYGAWSTSWNFNNGKIVFDGYQTINGYRYYYQNGVLQKNGIVGNSRDGYSYADKNGRIDTSYRGAVSSNGADWIVQNGKATKVATAADRNLFNAFKLLARITTSNMSNEQKLRASFNYIRDNYPEKNPRIPHYHGMDWPVIYANDILANGTGNCFSVGAALCYMAKAIGYTNVYACSSGGHGWAEINGLVYDAEWARHRFHSSYYALSYNTKVDVDYKAGIAPGQPWMHVKV